jgi:hypothetical protein
MRQSPEQIQTCEACGSAYSAHVLSLEPNGTRVVCRKCYSDIEHLRAHGRHTLHEAVTAIFHRYANVRLVRTLKPSTWFTCGCWESETGLCSHIVQRANKLIASGTPMAVPTEPGTELPPPCVCCGWRKRHRRWCLHHPDETISNAGCPSCAKRKKTCVKCLLEKRTKTTKLCLVCGQPFVPTSRFGRFTCSSCK